MQNKAKWQWKARHRYLKVANFSQFPFFQVRKENLWQRGNSRDASEEGGTISISLNVKYALGDERTRRRKKKLKKETIVRPTANSKEWLTKATGPGVWCWEVRSKRVVPEFMRAGIYGKTYALTPRRQVGNSSWKRLTLKNRELFCITRCFLLGTYTLKFTSFKCWKLSVTLCICFACELYAR